jgi:hypothetical protein
MGDDTYLVNVLHDQRDKELKSFTKVTYVVTEKEVSYPKENKLIKRLVDLKRLLFKVR